MEDDGGVCGYVLAAPDATEFHHKMSLSWLPEMIEKYNVAAEVDGVSLTKAQVSCAFSYTI